MDSVLIYYYLCTLDVKSVIDSVSPYTAVHNKRSYRYFF